ncbi:hypothetical protein FFLO_04859 [Filobasidium floriforme]|uniref:Uncharacterized protein n=1 Tax=Filobasidium floriforme TaxID=5210 RepID=A0A8K0NPH4_9TREE|nr:uncharacterized protein HD553DRAFT_320361 [Filobasidium floriforme]KAG7530689.1 hypothetical protein FFLO_04859 [Filobasidium floriforme]KAH8077810.1 hypothetical protein HD553DRAFT_320361 [Filobasidium floriforme]
MKGSHSRERKFPLLSIAIAPFLTLERMTQNRYKLRSVTRRFNVGQPTTARARSRTENRGLRELALQSYKEPDTEESEAENMTIIESRPSIPKAKARARAGKAQRARTSEKQSRKGKASSAKASCVKENRRGIPNYRELSSASDETSSDAGADGDTVSGCSGTYEPESDLHMDPDYTATGSDSDFEPNLEQSTIMAEISKRRG